jgi:sodium-coupled neutral amino acid transporter 11
MSFALKETGIGLGIILLIFVGFINDVSLTLMMRAGSLAGVSTYQDLMMFSFGRKGFYLLTVLQFLYPIIGKCFKLESAFKIFIFEPRFYLSLYIYDLSKNL